MAQLESRPTDEQVEQSLGSLLRWGVIASAVVVLAGGVLFLARHGLEQPEVRRVFEGEPSELRHPFSMVRDALEGHSRGVIQVGLLMLIATPVARVVFSVSAFARQRDYVYVILTLVVLAVLLYSLFVGYH
jgi:uncharacterized membrane protein